MIPLGTQGSGRHIHYDVLAIQLRHMRRKGKAITSVLQKECDTLLQRIGKLKMPRSEISGLPTEVIHHFHPKSVSNALRYDWDNLIPLTNGEHGRHHQANDPHIHGTVIQKRGQVWHDTLLKRRWQESVKTDKAYYLAIKDRLLQELSKIDV